MMMLNHSARAAAVPDGRGDRARRRGAGPTRLELHGARSPDRVPPRDRAAGLALRGRAASSLEKRVLLPHRQNTVHVTYRLLAGDGPVRLRAAAVGPLPPARRAGRRAARRAVRAHRRRTTATSSRPAAICRRCGCTLHGDARALHARPRRRSPDVVLPRSRRAAATTSRGDLLEPGLLPRRRSRRASTVTLVASTEPWETIRALDRRATRCAAERAAPTRLLDGRASAARDGHRRRAGAGRRPVHHHARRPRRGRRPRARRRRRGAHVIAGYHWFTDWGRDTMISLEGPDAGHRPPRARPATSCAPSPTTSATA